MSNQADARKGEVATDDWRVRNKGRKPNRLPYVIEWRFRELVPVAPGPGYKGRRNWYYGRSKNFGPWKKRSAYKSKDQRDRVFDKLMREGNGARLANDYIQYRIIDLES